MKKLKTKKVNLVLCWNNLKAMPPKEFPSVDEIISTSNILGALKETIPEFVEMIKEGEKLNTEIVSGKIKPEEVEKKRREYFQKSSKLEQEIGDKVVEVEFEDSDFNTFFQQFERWGKNWFNRVETYLEFRKDINQANSSPKEKK